MYDPYTAFRKHVLPNGLEVHLLPLDRPFVGVEIVVHSGSRNDSINRSGTAHFVEHLVGQNIPNCTHDHAKEFFDMCGGRTQFGTTGYLVSQYAFTVPSEIQASQKALGIFGSMLFEAQLKEHVERERQVIKREFNMTYPYPQKFEWDKEMRWALFKGHRLETWTGPLGDPPHFLTVSGAELQDFYDAHYTPSNVSLVVVGGFNESIFLKELAKSPFGIDKKGTRTPLVLPVESLPPSRAVTKRIKMSDFSNLVMDQTHYMAMWAIPANFSRQARRIFTQVLNKILFEEIREKLALAYDVDASYHGFQDIYEFKISAEVSPNASDAIDEHVHAAIQQVAQREDLFERKKASNIHRLQMNDDSGHELAYIAAEDIEDHHRIITLEEELEGVRRVTFKEVASVIEQLGRNRQYTRIKSP